MSLWGYIIGEEKALYVLAVVSSYEVELLVLERICLAKPEQDSDFI